MKCHFPSVINMLCLGNYKYEINDKSVVNKETCLYPKRHISKVAHCLYESMKCSYSVNLKKYAVQNVFFQFCYHRICNGNSFELLTRLWWIYLHDYLEMKLYVSNFTILVLACHLWSGFYSKDRVKRYLIRKFENLDFYGIQINIGKWD